MRPSEELTQREREVRDLALRGLSNRLIARELFIEESTVKTHMTRVLEKSGVRSRAALIATVVESRQGSSTTSIPSRSTRFRSRLGLVIGLGAVTSLLVVATLAAALVVLPGGTGALGARAKPVGLALAVRHAEPIELSGAGFLQSELDVPKGALSLSVRLICEETQWYSFSGGMEADRVGGCGGASEFRVPVPTTSQMNVSIFVSEESTFVAQLTFADSVVVSDPKLADNCEALSVFRSEVLKAELGFDDGHFDETQWREATGAAIENFEATTPEPLLDEQFDAMLAWTKTGSPGSLGIGEESLAVSTAWSFARQICEANASSLMLYAGGRGG